MTASGLRLDGYRLLLIVARGSGTIDVQRRLLTDRVAELWDLLRQNKELRGRVEKASCNMPRKTTSVFCAASGRISMTAPRS